MAKAERDFNTRNFLKYVLLFGGVAALMILTRPAKEPVKAGNTIPLYDLIITSRDAAGSIILNGISIGDHKAGEKPGKTRIALTPWLQNGDNKLIISTRQPSTKRSPFVLAELAITPLGGELQKNKLFELNAASTKTLTIKVSNMPAWQWQKGEATFHDTDELRSAVKRLHAAFAAKDKKKIRRTESPLFKDMEKMTGRQGLERRVFRNEIIEKGNLEPLPEIIIVPFDNGRIMRVTSPTREAPIRVFMDYGNGGKAIFTGQFWSRIDGEWFVVR